MSVEQTGYPDLRWAHRIVQRVIDYNAGHTDRKPPGVYAQRCACEVLGAASIDEAAAKLGISATVEHPRLRVVV